uniref:MIT domain-containing protein n=1 Tax=Acrobeloides nanus TaxID=290746 RepID=A0A914CN71_9BILA
MEYETLMSKARPALIEATQRDSMGNSEAALSKYTEGIGYLMEALNLENDIRKRDELRSRITSYISRAETLKSKSSVPVKVEFDQLRIGENTQGYTYEKIFSRCIDNKLTEVTVEDPYISAMHQVYNFLMFCELLVEKAKNLSWIRLITTDRNSKSDTHNRTSAFKELEASLNEHRIKLTVVYKEFHDREIKFNNGWTVKIGRGLDIYQSSSQFAIGSRNFSLRRCKNTTIDYVHLIS